MLRNLLESSETSSKSTLFYNSPPLTSIIQVSGLDMLRNLLESSETSSTLVFLGKNVYEFESSKLIRTDNGNESMSHDIWDILY
jgi:hypothetical protein